MYIFIYLFIYFDLCIYQSLFIYTVWVFTDLFLLLFVVIDWLSWFRYVILSVWASNSIFYRPLDKPSINSHANFRGPKLILFNGLPLLQARHWPDWVSEPSGLQARQHCWLISESWHLDWPAARKRVILYNIILCMNYSIRSFSSILPPLRLVVMFDPACTLWRQIMIVCSSFLSRPYVSSSAHN